MISVSAVLHVYGQDFSPSLAESMLGYALGSDKKEPIPGGSGELSDQGSAIIRYDWNGSLEPSFEKGVADLLPPSLPIFEEKELVATLRKCGAEEFTLYVNVAYEDQCNLELSPSLLAALAELGVTLAITCYDDA